MQERKHNTPPLVFEYTNWEGKTAIRKVIPLEIWYGETEWHPKKQYLLKALDVEKGEERNFAMKDIIRFIDESQIEAENG